MMKKFIITIIIIIVLLLVGFGSYYIYSNNSQDNIESLQTKVDKEIIYLNTTIISMMNKLNNITYANYKIVEEKVPVEENTQTNNEQTEENKNEQNQDKTNSEQNDQNTENTKNKFILYFANLIKTKP